jgi:hypothetical protein
MNKQGLVSLLMMEKISAEVKRRGKNYAKGYEKGIDLAIKLIEASEDEPKKPVVPQFVADWIEKHKKALSLRDAMNQAYRNVKVDKWLVELDEDGNFINQDLFARAWFDGYEVEKEKRYLVKMKNLNSEYTILTYIERLNQWLFSDGKSDPVYYRKTHTLKELEKANFGWVFDCPGVEVQEVKG